MNNDLIYRIRTVLNILFMLGAISAIVLYFIPSVNPAVITYICFAALAVKMVELVLRHVSKFNSRKG